MQSIRNTVAWLRKGAKISQNSMWESEKLLVREVSSKVMAAKKKKPELFDLCKKAAAMKQIKIASSAKDPQKKGRRRN